MMTTTRYLVTAAIAAVLATMLVARGLVDRQLAAAERELSVLDTNAAARRLDAVHTRLGLTRPIPWLFDTSRRTVAAQRAVARYWRGEYATLVAEYPDPGQADVQDNIPLQLTLSAAHVREAIRRAADGNDSRLAALERAVGVYAQALRSTNGHPDVAFNYELLVRQRDALAAGEDPAALEQASPLGQTGGSGEDDMDMLGDMNDVQIYVPSDMLGRESTDEPSVGSDAPVRRRG